MLRTLLSKLVGSMHRRRAEDDFDEEVREHLQMLKERFIAQGMGASEAHRAALLQFGGVTQAKEDLRELRRVPYIETALRESRNAVRQLWRARWFTATVVLIMALGIGATTSVFAVLDAVVLRPLPYSDPDRLVAFGAANQTQGSRSSLSYPAFFDFREQNEVFSHIVSYRDSQFILTDSQPSIQAIGAIVSWDLFPLLGIQPALGRGFMPEEELPGSSAVILSNSLWKGRFDGDKAVLGRTISINGSPYTVVGIAPQGFQFPMNVPDVQLWVTLAQDARAHQQRGGRMLAAIARLKDGISAQQAQQQLDLLADAVVRRFPEQASCCADVWVEPELVRLTGSTRRPLWLLLTAVGLLLAIACANVANLLWARGRDRTREFILRAAIGASRTTLLRQMMAENFALAVAGAIPGVLLTWAILEWLLPLVGANLPIPRIAQIGLDGRVLTFSVSIAILTSLAFGLAPALGVVRVSPAAALKEGSAAVARGRSRFSSSLVIGQIALGLLLIAGAGMLASSYFQLTQAEPGFQSDHLLTFEVGLPGARYTDAAQMALSDRLLEQMQAIPGVQAAAAARPLPLQGRDMSSAFDIEGHAPALDRPRSAVAIVTPGYFHAMGIPVRRGRDFHDLDQNQSQPVLVVNEAFARRFFPGEDPVGKRIQPGFGEKMMREIVGVVGDTRQAPLGAAADPIIYYPYKQLPWSIGTIVLRTAGPPMDLESAARAVLQGLDSQAALYRVRTGDELSAGAESLVQIPTVVMSGFAAIALLLSATGLYGLLSYTVSRRRREFGVRVALGATRREVLDLVLREAGALVVAGLVLGCLAALGAGRVLERLLFGAQSSVVASLVGAGSVMLIISVAAAYLPAARAASVAPLEALKNE